MSRFCSTARLALEVDDGDTGSRARRIESKELRSVTAVAVAGRDEERCTAGQVGVAQGRRELGPAEDAKAT